MVSARLSRAPPGLARRSRSRAHCWPDWVSGGAEAAKLALIGNTAPVAFGSVGIPLITLAKVTGLDLRALSAMESETQLPLFALLIPFWLVAVVDGKRGAARGMAGLFDDGRGVRRHPVRREPSAVGPGWWTWRARWPRFWLLLILLRFWRPTGPAAVQPAPSSPGPVSTAPGQAPPRMARRRCTRGCRWILLCAVVFAWSLAGVHDWLDRVLGWTIAMPGLHLAVVAGCRPW